jgi:peptidoglycan biosynthesis protein MviN/MurJ (putative lipid II flippase)
MFLKAGALSLALLLASRLLGVLRETTQAAAFGTSGMADVAVLLLTLPDWIATVAASGALAYVLLPAWAARPAGEVDRMQRRVAAWGAVFALALSTLLVLGRVPSAQVLAAGLSPGLQALAAGAMVWSAVALPLALLAALWVTRLQHESDFVGMYGANLVVNVLLIASIAAAGARPRETVPLLGLGLLLAMVTRLAWLGWRMPRRGAVAAAAAALPPPPVWMWAVLSAGLPFALPFAARSLASQAGEGALATFNYAWKLVELPLLLAIQLVATIAFPRIAAALAGDAAAAALAIRSAFLLAWTLACAAAAGLLFAAPALADLLFGWGRMRTGALQDVASWGMAGAWGLLPQAVSAVALTVLAARARMRPAVAGYAAGLLLLLATGLLVSPDGLVLMLGLNIAYVLAAVAAWWALGPERTAWLPWREAIPAAAMLLLVAAAAVVLRPLLASAGSVVGLSAGGLAATAVLAVSLWRSSGLRMALRR